MDKELDGWVIIWVAKDSGYYPRMTSNIADEEIARDHARGMEQKGIEVVAVCEAERLRNIGLKWTALD